MNCDNGIPATLRRRAKVLERDGYEAGWVAVLRRAADELHVRQAFAQGCPKCADENLAVVAIAENRRLRNALVALADVVKVSEIPVYERKNRLESIRTALLAAKPLGHGRAILALEVYPGQTREDLDVEVARILDAHFTEKAHGEESKEGEAEEPGRAGRDPHQHPVAEGGAREAGGEPEGGAA